MALHDNPPHRVALYTSASGTDAGGGVSLTYTLSQSAIPCSINTASSSEQERFAQQGMVVTHTVAFLASVFTTTPKRGDKIVTADRTESFHVRGISYGRAYGNIPAFVYLACEQQL
jgi:hypothetical protein